MVADLAAAERLCDLDEAARAALTSPRRPIVLAPRRARRRVVAAVSRPASRARPAPALQPAPPPAAGRRRPAAGDDEREPQRRADRPRRRRRRRAARAAWSTACSRHDRPIHIRCDDSVVRAVAGPAAGAAALPGLRARAGPRCPSPPRRPVLAVGAELKSTVAVAKGDDRRAQPPHRRPRAPGHAPLVPAGPRPPLRTSTASRPRSSPTTCTRSTCRRSSPSSSTCPPSACSTTTPTSRRAWSSTAGPSRSLGLAFDGLGYGARRHACGAARCSWPTCAGTSGSAT